MKRGRSIAGRSLREEREGVEWEEGKVKEEMLAGKVGTEEEEEEEGGGGEG